jgi:hypothetical protein
MSLLPVVLATRPIGTPHMKFQISTVKYFLAWSELCVIFTEANRNIVLGILSTFILLDA